MAMQAKANDFRGSDTKAKFAEDRFKKVLERDNAYAVVSVRGELKYQKLDVDLLATDKATGADFRVEVKSDDRWWEGGNFALENIGNIEKGNTPGWGLATKADYIAIYYPAVDRFYVLEGPKLVNWFTANQDRFWEKTNATRGYDGTILYHSKFRCVPRAIVEQEVGFVAVIDAKAYLS